MRHHACEHLELIVADSVAVICGVADCLWAEVLVAAQVHVDIAIKDTKLDAFLACLFLGPFLWLDLTFLVNQIANLIDLTLILAEFSQRQLLFCLGVPDACFESESSPVLLLGWPLILLERVDD